MRITSGMITSQYNRNLNKSLSQLNYYNNRATTLRKFDRASQDPVAAAKAYSLRRSYTQNENYDSNVEEAKSTLTIAESAVTNLNKVAQEIASTDMLQGITGTMSKDDRQIVATKLKKMQETIISTMNASTGGKYIFGGTNSSVPPFSVDATGNLLYQGVNVTTGEFAGAAATTNVGGANIDFGIENGDKLNGYTINIVSGAAANVVDSTNKSITIHLAPTATKQDLQNSLQGLTLANGLPAGIDPTKITVKGTLTDSVVPGAAKISGGENAVAGGPDGDALLLKLSKETQFVDLGLGLNFKNGALDEQSAYDTSLPGISFLGFGVDTDGNPKNMFALLGKVADNLSSDPFSVNNTQPFIDGFNKQKQNVLNKLTEFGSKSNFLDYIGERLADSQINLNSKIKSVEYVDTAQAIMDFKMQEYAYMAALQMGTKIIQPTFLDYMR